MVKMGPQMNSIELRLAEPVDLEAVEVYVHRANVSLVLSIQDVEENCLSRISRAFSAPPLEMGVAAYPWVTRYLSLKRVSTLLLQAAPLTSSEEGKWAVDILEIRLQSTPSLPCAAGGFSDVDKGCEAPLEIPSSLDSLDCEGDWEDWSICDTSCTRTRRFRVTALPKEGGIPCVTHEVEPCTGGGLCSTSGSAKHIQRGSLPQQKDSGSSTPGSSTDCASMLSSKSPCVSCRTLQTYQITRQATGEGQRCPEERFVLGYCDANCASVYGPTTTTAAPTTETLPLLAPSSSPLLDLHSARDVMLLLKTVAMYFLVFLLACLVTTYLVGFFQGGLLGRKAAGSIDYTAVSQPTRSSSTMPAINSCSGTAANGNRTVPTRNSVVSKRNSTSSRKFGNGIQSFRQSLLGGNLLRNASEDESDCLGDNDTSA